MPALDAVHAGLVEDVAAVAATGTLDSPAKLLELRLADEIAWRDIRVPVAFAVAPPPLTGAGRVRVVEVFRLRCAVAYVKVATAGAGSSGRFPVFAAQVRPGGSPSSPLSPDFALERAD